ncbi:MAG: hypothetical protein OEY58_19825 [Gammaproteobacteria bacterium]|nr:hypothetical protein [Gammaproteobacteria bacterium]
MRCLIVISLVASVLYGCGFQDLKSPELSGPLVPVNDPWEPVHKPQRPNSLQPGGHS